jgi:hypothetical protein
LENKNNSKNLRRKSEAVRGGKQRNRRFSGEHDLPQAHKDSRMNVLFLTIFISTALALFFVGAFLYHHDFSGGDAMRDSLLPFNKEKSPAPAAEKTAGETKTP